MNTQSRATPYFCEHGFTGTQPCLFVYLLSIAAFVPPQQGSVDAAVSVWPMKSNQFTPLPFMGKACSPLERGRCISGESCSARPRVLKVATQPLPWLLDHFPYMHL